MPVCHKVFADENCLFLRFHGDVRIQDLLQSMDIVDAEPGLSDSFVTVVDFSGVGAIAVPMQDLMNLVSLMSGLGARRKSPSRRLIYVTNSQAYHVIRAFSALLSRGAGPKPVIFRNPKRLLAEMGLDENSQIGQALGRPIGVIVGGTDL